MLPHSAWWLAVDALAVYRLAILLTKDTITEPLRDWVRAKSWAEPVDMGSEHEMIVILSNRWRRLHELITCPWCVSIWFGAGAVALTRFWPQGWQYVAMALALSAVAGFLGER